MSKKKLIQINLFFIVFVISMVFFSIFLYADELTKEYNFSEELDSRDKETEIDCISGRLGSECYFGNKDVDFKGRGGKIFILK